MLRSLLIAATALVALSASASIPLPKVETQLTQNSTSSKDDDGMCRWFGSAPLCDGQCVWPYTVQKQESTTGDGKPCTSGHKVYCCKEYIGEGDNCKWFGTAPFCKGECEAPYTHQVSSSNSGDGQSCWSGQKVYCCY